MDVSIVLPSFNRESLLGTTLPVYLKMPVKEVILCDDGSTDNTKDLASELACQKLIYHRNPTNLGTPANRNVGVNLSKSKWIVMGEDDVIMDEEYITSLYTSAINLNADVVAGRLIRLQRGECREQAKKSSDNEHNTRFYHLKSLAFDYSCLFDQPFETPWLHACSLFKRDWAITYPYDESYAGNALREESDFYLRCHDAGAKMFFCSDAIAYHMFHDYRGGNRQGHLWYGYHSLVNNHKFIEKHWHKIKQLLSIEQTKNSYKRRIQINILRMTFLFWANARIPHVHSFLKKMLKK